MIKIGDKLGNFAIKAEIGRGGMGTIFFALDTMLGREVALKVVHPQLADNQQLMERFKIEAMTQARLNHPNIVTIFSFNKIEDEYVIAMEYVEGRSLKEMLQEKKQLQPDVAVDIIAQVAEGLRYAHAHNVIHRDIKPANILVGRDGKVKISDFGIAKILGAQGLTKTGMLIGTPWYTSPEQIVGKEIDFRTDLYSLGVTFYEVLTGRVPFDSETNSEFQIQKAHLETPPPRPSIFNPEIGIKLEKFILLALQKKAEKRFQSARDMIDELHRIRADMTRAGLTSSPGVTQKIVMPEEKKRRFLSSPLKIIAFLLLLLAGVALFVFLAGKSGMKEGRGTAASAMPAVEKAGGEPPVTEKAGSEPLQLAKDKPQPVAAEKKQETETAAAKEADPGPLEPAAPGAAGMNPTQRDLEPGKGQARVEPPAPGSLQEEQAGVDKLGPLDEELSRLRGFLETRDLAAADRLTRALLRSGADSRAFPMLGKVKFFLGQFPAAAELWSRALDDNLLVSLEMVHRHGGSDDFCLGQLKFKKKLILFNSNTRGDHSFALTAENLRPLILDGGTGIRITGTAGGQEIDESFLVAGKMLRRQKEKFLVEFLNQHVL